MSLRLMPGQGRLWTGMWRMINRTVKRQASQVLDGESVLGRIIKGRIIKGRIIKGRIVNGRIVKGLQQDCNRIAGKDRYVD